MSGPGKVLVAAVAVRIDSATGVKAPTGWADVLRTVCGPKNPVTQAIFVKVASAAEPATYTFARSISTSCK